MRKLEMSPVKFAANLVNLIDKSIVPVICTAEKMKVDDPNATE